MKLVSIEKPPICESERERERERERPVYIGEIRHVCPPI
jgi:hypothetical protein